MKRSIDQNLALEYSKAAAILGRKGGKARLTTMTSEARRAVAIKGARARWGKKKPKPAVS